jgi:hypothetical protein
MLPHGMLEAHDALQRTLDSRLLAEHRMPLSAFEGLSLSPSKVSRPAIELETRRHMIAGRTRGLRRLGIIRPV